MAAKQLKDALLAAHKHVLVFAAMMATDFIWARWMNAVAEKNALAASFWTTGTILLGAFVVVSYVKDKRLVWAAAAGGFFGTYVSMSLL